MRPEKANNPLQSPTRERGRTGFPGLGVGFCTVLGDPVKGTTAILLSLSLAAFLTPQARAHSLGAECKVNGAKVDLEAYYSDDTAARQAKVEVRNSAGEKMAAGTTDDDGRWSFARPGAGRYEVIVDAGAGHRTTVRLEIVDTNPGAPGTEEAHASDAPANKGPSRSEFTRIPWLRIFLGFGIIGLLAIACHLWVRRFRTTSTG